MIKTNKDNNSKGNIVVVDDSPINLRLIVDMFKSKGYEVRPVPSGKLALTAIKNLPPDLILLDVMMPEMDGYAVCEKLKADPKTKDIPIIFVSALDAVLDKVKAFEMGGVDYVSKPIQEKELFARVETHLEIRRLQKHLQERNNKLVATLQQLKQAQSQLVESEKMAVLGQLVAGISHEINTPLGAIRSSVENLADFLGKDIKTQLNFWQTIDHKQQPYFLELLRYPALQALSSREKRKLKRKLRNTLDSANIEHKGDSKTMFSMPIVSKKNILGTLGCTLAIITGTLTLETTPRNVQAQTLAPNSPLTVRSDIQEANSETGVVTARGNVQFFSPARQIQGTSAQAQYFSRERRLVLTGDVYVLQEGNSMRAETMTYLIDEGRFIATPETTQQVESIYLGTENQNNPSHPAPVSPAPPLDTTLPTPDF